MPETFGAAPERGDVAGAAKAEASRPHSTSPQADRIIVSAAEWGFDSEIAVRIALGEHEMRRDLASGILRAFVIGNSAVWLLVLLLLATDVLLMVSGHETAADRIIDRGVVKTLVGATAVQVGIIMVAIAGNLFPRLAPDGSPQWKRW